MRKSKFLNQTFGNWTCTHVGVASVQPKICKYKKAANGRKAKAKSPGSRQYYYVFERLTSDGKAEKLIRLNAVQAAKVYNGLLTVEEVAVARQAAGVDNFTEKVSYHFIGA